MKNVLILSLWLSISLGLIQRGEAEVLVIYGAPAGDSSEKIPLKCLKAESVEVTADTVWLNVDGERWPFARSKVQMVLEPGSDQDEAIKKFPELAEEIRAAMSQVTPSPENVTYVLPPGTRLPVADDLRQITTRDGEIFTGIESIARDPDGISIGYAGGIVKIPFEQMPEELIERFKMKYENALAYREELRRQRTIEIQAEAQRAVQINEVYINAERERAERLKRQEFEGRGQIAQWKVIQSAGRRAWIVTIQVGQNPNVDWSAAESFLTLRAKAKEVSYGMPQEAVLLGYPQEWDQSQNSGHATVYPVKASFYWEHASTNQNVLPVYALSVDHAIEAEENFAVTGILNRD